LNYKNNQGHWNVDPALLDTPLQQVCESETGIDSANPFSCLHELWIALDLDDESWMSYSKFTLRLSWPASVRCTLFHYIPKSNSRLLTIRHYYQSPADFLLEIHSPQAILTRLSRLPHQSAIDDASITTPHLSRTGLSTTRLKYARIRVVDTGIRTPSPDLPVSAVQAIPFVLILEQLYFGVLPASLLPTVCFLIIVLSCAALATPWILGYLDHFIKQARQELRDFSTAQKKKEH
jgi:hypothetical protein